MAVYLVTYDGMDAVRAVLMPAGERWTEVTTDGEFVQVRIEAPNLVAAIDFSENALIEWRKS